MPAKLELMERQLGENINYQDEITRHFIQQLSFFLYYYKSLHFMSFKGNTTLYTQTIILLSIFILSDST